MTSAKIIHVPHASVFIPDKYREQFILDARDIKDEARQSADLYTDVLAREVWPNALIIEAPVSRIVCDVERYVDDADEDMASVGRGMIYSRTHLDKRMRRDLTPEERDAIRHEVYEPHWQRLRAAANGSVLIDLHSYPKEVWPIEPEQTAARPEIDLGTTEGLTPPDWAESLRRNFEEAGYEVGLNTPYAGVIDAGADAAVMIEIRRDMLGLPGSVEWERIVSVLKTLPSLE